jgi:hypothetical protein
MVLTNCPPSSAPISLSLLPDIVNPIVWDISSPSVASHHSPIKIYLKDPKSHPNRPQYPISLKYRWGVKPLIDKLLDKEIFKPTHSPCNMLILPILKPDGSYRLVQDLRNVNSAVLLPILWYPTHIYYYLAFLQTPPIFLSLILRMLSSLSPFTLIVSLFAFMLGLAQQLTWTILPQGFRASPHFFGQALAWDLSSLNLQLSTLL